MQPQKNMTIVKTYKERTETTYKDLRKKEKGKKTDAE